MVVIKYGCGLLGLKTLKSAVSQELIDELGWYFACWYKCLKTKSCFNNYCVGAVKNGWGLKDRGTLKPGKSQMIWWIEQIDWMVSACW